MGDRETMTRGATRAQSRLGDITFIDRDAGRETAVYTFKKRFSNLWNYVTRSYDHTVKRD